VDAINAFSSAGKLCAYAGVVRPPRQRWQNQARRLLPFAINGCAGALVEAVGGDRCSPYFGALYKQHRARGKKANTAVLHRRPSDVRIIWRLVA